MKELRTYLFAIITLMLFSCQPGPETMMKQADDLVLQNNYDQAIRLYDRILKTDSTIQLALFNRGICYFNTHHYQKAIENYNLLLRKISFPKGLYFKVNRHSPFASFEAKMLVYPEEVFFERAKARYYMDSLNGSLKDFISSIDYGTEYKTDCYRWIANIYLRTGNVQGACDYIGKLYQLGDLSVKYEFSEICEF